MIEPGSRFGLGAKSRQVGRRRGAGVQDHLQGHGAAQASLARLIDDAHTAAAELFEELIVAERHARPPARGAVGRVGIAFVVRRCQGRFLARTAARPASQDLAARRASAGRHAVGHQHRGPQTAQVVGQFGMRGGQGLDVGRLAALQAVDQRVGQLGQQALAIFRRRRWLRRSGRLRGHDAWPSPPDCEGGSCSSARRRRMARR